jgi:hypothetical protein
MKDVKVFKCLDSYAASCTCGLHISHPVCVLLTLERFRFTLFFESSSATSLSACWVQTSNSQCVQTLLDRSREWVDFDEVDDAIEFALDNPIDIYAHLRSWKEEEEGEEREEREGEKSRLNEPEPSERVPAFPHWTKQDSKMAKTRRDESEKMMLEWTPDTPKSATPERAIPVWAASASGSATPKSATPERAIPVWATSARGSATPKSTTPERAIPVWATSARGSATPKSTTPERTIPVWAGATPVMATPESATPETGLATAARILAEGGEGEKDKEEQGEEYEPYYDDAEVAVEIEGEGGGEIGKDQDKE